MAEQPTRVWIPRRPKTHPVDWEGTAGDSLSIGAIFVVASAFDLFSIHCQILDGARIRGNVFQSIKKPQVALRLGVLDKKQTCKRRPVRDYLLELIQQQYNSKQPQAAAGAKDWLSSENCDSRYMISILVTCRRPPVCQLTADRRQSSYFLPGSILRQLQCLPNNLKLAKGLLAIVQIKSVDSFLGLQDGHWRRFQPTFEIARKIEFLGFRAASCVSF